LDSPLNKARLSLSGGTSHLRAVEIFPGRDPALDVRISRIRGLILGVWFFQGHGDGPSGQRRR